MNLLKRGNWAKTDPDGIHESKLDKVNALLKKIFPHLEIITRAYEQTILVKNIESGTEYGLNQLSDGEKSVLFYLSIVMLADDDTIFVVDEPETHINLALSTKMWDLILKEKRESRFIFISHDIQFIQSRHSKNILWCVRYKNRFDNKLERLKDDELRKAIIQISGARKSILFCEGTYDSLDYKLLNLLYSDSYLVKPVGGHKQVIEYTRVIRRSGLFSGEVIGIIDSDMHSEQILSSYKRDKIYHLPANEIEMMFLHPSLISDVFKHTPPNKRGKRPSFEEVKIRIKEELNSAIEQITSLYVKHYIETEVFAINNLNNFEDIDKECINIVEKLKILQSVYDERKSLLEDIFADDSENGFLQWLKYSPLKGKLSSEVMNKFESNYLGRALLIIENNEEMRCKMRDWIGIK